MNKILISILIGSTLISSGFAMDIMDINVKKENSTVLGNDPNDRDNIQESLDKRARSTSHLSVTARKKIINDYQALYTKGNNFLYDKTNVEKSMEMEDPDAYFIWALMIVYERVESKNKEQEALDCFLKASTKNQLDAKAYLYFVYKNGLLGQTVNLVEAEKYKFNVCKEFLDEGRFIPINEKDLKISGDKYLENMRKNSIDKNRKKKDCTIL